MTLTNAKMVAGRFAKLAKGRARMRRMNACWDRGGFVRICTATIYTDLQPKHRALITMDAKGSLYMAHGKRSDCIDYASLQFSA